MKRNLTLFLSLTLIFAGCMSSHDDGSEGIEIVMKDTGAAVSPIENAMPEPPVAVKRPHKLEIHGDVRVDDYYWLRDREDPEVIAYLEAENEYLNAMMRQTEALQETLYEEIVARIPQTDESVPVRLNDYYYYRVAASTI